MRNPFKREPVVCVDALTEDEIRAEILQGSRDDWNARVALVRHLVRQELDAR